ncbi:MAG: hypothetical protein AAF141_05805 [Pseudomonadota bacterium]
MKRRQSLQLVEDMPFRDCALTSHAGAPDEVSESPIGSELETDKVETFKPETRNALADIQGEANIATVEQAPELPESAVTNFGASRAVELSLNGDQPLAPYAQEGLSGGATADEFCAAVADQPVTEPTVQSAVQLVMEPEQEAGSELDHADVNVAVSISTPSTDERLSLRPAEEYGAYDLERLPTIGPGQIWHLQQAGIYSLDDLASVSAENLTARLGSLARLMRLREWVSLSQAMAK